MTVRAQGTCPRCSQPDQLLYRSEPTDPDAELVCPECCRRQARVTRRTQPCDTCGRPGAWRNPKHRRNEYLCGLHHAESPEGVTLNRWFPRVSNPHSQGRRPVCFAAAGPTPCRGEIKPRGPEARVLCTKHAGKTSAAWAVEDGLV